MSGVWFFKVGNLKVLRIEVWFCCRLVGLLGDIMPFWYGISSFIGLTTLVMFEIRLLDLRDLTRALLVDEIDYSIIFYNSLDLEAWLFLWLTDLIFWCCDSIAVTVGACSRDCMLSTLLLKGP